MTQDPKKKLSVENIERLLNTSSTSSIYDTLTKIQQGEIKETGIISKKLDIDSKGFSRHRSLTEAIREKPPKNELIIEPVVEKVTKSFSLPTSLKQELEKTPMDYLKSDHYQVAVISSRGNHKEFQKSILTISGKTLEFSLKLVVDHSDETIKRSLDGSNAGIIVLPPLTDINDIQIVINKHVAELWSYNGLGPVPFIIIALEGKTGSVTLRDLEQTIKAFIENLTPITRGNYGFGIKYTLIKTLESEKELRTILRTLAILLISYDRFKTRKNDSL